MTYTPAPKVREALDDLVRRTGPGQEWRITPRPHEGLVNVLVTGPWLVADLNFSAELWHRDPAYAELGIRRQLGHAIDKLLADGAAGWLAQLVEARADVDRLRQEVAVLRSTDLVR